MKSFRYISIVLVFLLALVGCKDSMRELNTNSDLVDDTQVKYMFTGATQNFDFSGRSTPGYYNSLHKLMQYHVYYTLKTDPYRDVDLDNAVQPSYLNGVAYGELFSQEKGNRLFSIMNYIETQVAEADQPKYQDIEAICNGLLAYLEWRVFENYGASVYSEAFQAISSNITQPKYDYIEDSWQTIDDQLKESVAQLAKAPIDGVQTLGTSDFFTGYTSTPTAAGGVTINTQSDNDKSRAAWLRFFNMVRLEIAWKLQGRQPAHFNTVFNECKAVAGGHMTNIDEGFYYYYAHDYLADDDMQEPEAYHVVGEPFINTLVAHSDPRLPLLARPNGATSETSITFNMMKDYFQDSLDKYPIFDGKHPYVGISPNPANQGSVFTKEDASAPNAFVSNYIYTFTDLENPNGTAEFTYTDPNGYSHKYCEDGKEKFDASILIASETQYRYWVMCGARHNADHSFGGNGISGLGASYYTKYHGDGQTEDEGGKTGLAVRGRIFTYAKQCFMLAAIGQEFGGKSAAEWYEEGVKAAMVELREEAQRVRIQAKTGGDSGFEYPASLTMTSPSGDVTFDYPYTYDDATIDAYVAANPYSVENLYDQIYIYGFLDPYTSWCWWRKTGYPQFISHDTPEAAAAEAHAYLEQPWVKDGDKKAMPRRGCLPDRNALNPNYLEAKQHLITVDGFGDWEETNGRIWWEVQ